MAVCGLQESVLTEREWCLIPCKQQAAGFPGGGAGHVDRLEEEEEEEEEVVFDLS